MSKETIWQLLKRKGFSDVAAAALMGNMEAESNCESNRVQGDFSADRRASADYTARIDSGTISRHDFIHCGPNGGGYGLCQWTYPARKAGLYDLARTRGVSIGDETMQVDYLVQELRQGEHAAVLHTLQTSASIRACSDAMLKGFEKPADQSDATCALRADYARQFYNRFAGTGEAETESHPTVGIVPPLSGKDEELYNRALLIVLYLKSLKELLDEFEVPAP